MRTIQILFILLIILVVFNTYPAIAIDGYGIPIKVLIMVDENPTYGDSRSSNSELSQNIKAALDINKIPFEMIDIADINNLTFWDKSSNLKYSVLLLICPGWRIEPAESNIIMTAVEKGMGIVGLSTDSTNEYLTTVFGIDQPGKVWCRSDSINLIEDRFTFSYSGISINEDWLYLDHQLLPDIETVATFDDTGQPALWTYHYGAGNTVFHNHTNTLILTYQGILLQSILYAMPIGVACPVNAGVIEVDDCPRAFYSTKQLDDWYHTFYFNFKEWLRTYNFTASFFVAFSYSGNTDDFWVYRESLECANDIIESGYELGLHCGSMHVPLKIDNWGSETAISTAIDEMMQAWQLLETRLANEYHTQLEEPTSYVAPSMQIDDFGYEAIDTMTSIRYVGTSLYNVNQVTARDFGWEKDLDIYNLPRTKGDFYDFSLPGSKQRSLNWAILRSVIESGAPYLIFTHPDETELLRQEGWSDVTINEVFEGYKVWADYISRYYPFYRWWTSSELGRYLEKREGCLDAVWFPEDHMLRLQLSQLNDTVHLKTDLYLKHISRYDHTIIFEFITTPYDFKSDEYDVVHICNDYFVYPADSKLSRPIIPENPFTLTTTPKSQNIQKKNGLSVLTLVSIIATCIIFIIGVLLPVMKRKANRYDQENKLAQ